MHMCIHASVLYYTGFALLKYIFNLKYYRKNIVYQADDVVLLIACFLNTHGVLGLMSWRD